MATDGVFRPVGREAGLLVEAVGDELLVYDTERHLAHSVNSVAASVWRACDGRRDVDGLAGECGLDRAAVELALKQLGDVHLLSVPLPAGASGSGGGVSRRAMLRRGVLAGAGVGIALPVIRSITAPSLAMAYGTRSGNQVKGQAGEPCASYKQCANSSSCISGSCQRTDAASCSHTSSCVHFVRSDHHYTQVCVTSGDGAKGCAYCTSNAACPGGYTCNGSGLCVS